MICILLKENGNEKVVCYLIVLLFLILFINIREIFKFIWIFFGFGLCVGKLIDFKDLGEIEVIVV